MKFVGAVLKFIAPTAYLANGRTVRYVFSFMFVLAALLGTASVISKDNSYVSLSTPQKTVNQSDIITLDVYVYAHTPINAVDIALRFPQDQVTVLSIDKGQSVLTLWTEEPKFENGLVTLRGGTYKKGFIGEHKIASIEVRSKTTGSIEFLADSTRLLAGDGKGTEIASGETPSVVVQVTDNNTPASEASVSDSSLEAKAFVVVATDIDADGAITLKDISSFMASWFSTDTVFDFNSDGKMSIQDFSILLADYFYGE